MGCVWEVVYEWTGSCGEFQDPIIKCHFQQYFNYIMQGIFLNILVEKAGKKNTKKSTYAISAYHH